MSVTIKELETELGTVKERVKTLERQLESESNKRGSVNSSVSRLVDSVAELKQNFNTLHSDVQDRLKVLYNKAKK